MIYAERLAQRVFEFDPRLDATGPAGAVLSAAWPLAVRDLGHRSAQCSFELDEDFPSELVTAYAALQRLVSTD